eukprot:372852_1
MPLRRSKRIQLQHTRNKTKRKLSPQPEKSKSTNAKKRKISEKKIIKKSAPSQNKQRKKYVIKSELFPHKTDHASFKLIFVSIYHSKIKTSLNIPLQIIKEISEFSAGKFKKCQNFAECGKQFSVLHSDYSIATQLPHKFLETECGADDWDNDYYCQLIYEPQDINDRAKQAISKIGYFQQEGKLFCKVCIDKYGYLDHCYECGSLCCGIGSIHGYYEEWSPICNSCFIPCSCCKYSQLKNTEMQTCVRCQKKYCQASKFTECDFCEANICSECVIEVQCAGNPCRVNSKPYKTHECCTDIYELIECDLIGCNKKLCRDYGCGKLVECMTRYCKGPRFLLQFCADHVPSKYVASCDHTACDECHKCVVDYCVNCYVR